MLDSKLEYSGFEKLTGYVPMRVVLTNKDVKAIEDDNGDEEDQGKPGSVWLETTSEHKSVAVDSLGLESLVKLDVCNANRAPSEKGGDGGEILEPSERFRWTTWCNGEISEACNRTCDHHSKVRHTSLAASCRRKLARNKEQCNPDVTYEARSVEPACSGLVQRGNGIQCREKHWRWMLRRLE